MAASIHFLSAIDNAGYFEADLSKFNPFRSELCTSGFTRHGDCTVEALDTPGLGVEVDEARLSEFPVITGPGYV